MTCKVSNNTFKHVLNICYRLVRFLLAAVFIWSGTAKILAPQSFVYVIDAFGIVPEALVWPTALGLSICELVAGIGLVFDLKWSLGIITGLLGLFIVVLSYGLWLGLDVDCGCFGPDDPEGQAFHSLRPALYRDLVMLLSISFLYFWRYNQSLRPRRLPMISIINVFRR